MSGPGDAAPGSDARVDLSQTPVNEEDAGRVDVADRAEDDLTAAAGGGPPVAALPDDARPDKTLDDEELEPAAGDEPAVPGAVTLGAVERDDLAGALEAVLLVVDSPVTEQQLATAVGHGIDTVRSELIAMAGRLAEARSGIDLREIGGGWRFYTRDRYAAVVERFVLDGQQSRLSRAAMETLAVIAYRQPVNRARIAAVRGVNVDGVMRTLVARGLIQEAGTDGDPPGTGATLYRTTELFLERLGLGSLDELPELGPLLPDIDAIDEVRGEL